MHWSRQHAAALLSKLVRSTENTLLNIVPSAIQGFCWGNYLEEHWKTTRASSVSFGEKDSGCQENEEQFPMIICNATDCRTNHI